MARSFNVSGWKLLNPQIKFRTQCLVVQNANVPMVEVDVMDVFKEIYPEDYNKCITSAPEETIGLDLKFRDFNVQEGKVLVGLQTGIGCAGDGSRR